MNEQKKFKVGDRVRTIESLMYLPANITGVIVGKQADGRFKVQIDEEEDLYAFYYPKQLDLIESYDPKTAFLSELKELLAKYDASIIGGGYEGYGDYLQVQLGMDEPFDVGESEYGDRCILTADNVMNYDKE